MPRPNSAPIAINHPSQPVKHPWIVAVKLVDMPNSVPQTLVSVVINKFMSPVKSVKDSPPIDPVGISTRFVPVDLVWRGNVPGDFKGWVGLVIRRGIVPSVCVRGVSVPCSSECYKREGNEKVKRTVGDFS